MCNRTQKRAERREEQRKAYKQGPCLIVVELPVRRLVEQRAPNAAPHGVLVNIVGTSSVCTVEDVVKAVFLSLLETTDNTRHNSHRNPTQGTARKTSDVQRHHRVNELKQWQVHGLKQQCRCQTLESQCCKGHAGTKEMNKNRNRSRDPHLLPLRRKKWPQSHGHSQISII